MEVMMNICFSKALGGRRKNGGDVLKALGNVESEVDEEAVARCLNLVGGEEYKSLEEG